MTFIQILLLIFVVFLCVFAVVDRICKYKEEKIKNEREMLDAAWKEFLEKQNAVNGDQKLNRD